MFANAAITIRVLRSHIRSSIPVEIVHYGPKELPAAEILSFIKSFNSTQADDASGPTGSSSSSSSSSSTAGSGVSSSSAASGPVFITDGLAAAPPEVVAALHRKLPEGIKGFPAKVYALTHVTRFRQVRGCTVYGVCLGVPPTGSCSAVLFAACKAQRGQPSGQQRAAKTIWLAEQYMNSLLGNRSLLQRYATHPT